MQPSPFSLSFFLKSKKEGFSLRWALFLFVLWRLLRFGPYTHRLQHLAIYQLEFIPIWNSIGHSLWMPEMWCKCFLLLFLPRLIFLTLLHYCLVLCWITFSGSLPSQLSGHNKCTTSFLAKMSHSGELMSVWSRIKDSYALLLLKYNKMKLNFVCVCV